MRMDAYAIYHGPPPRRFWSSTFVVHLLSTRGGVTYLRKLVRCPAAVWVRGPSVGGTFRCSVAGRAWPTGRWLASYGWSPGDECAVHGRRRRRQRHTSWRGRVLSKRFNTRVVMGDSKRKIIRNAIYPFRLYHYRYYYYYY